MLFLVLFFATICIADETSIVNLRVEYAVNPIGVDTSQPRFSWEFSSTSTRQITQTTYRIMVSKDKNMDGMVWDIFSTSNNSFGIEYAGITLEPETRYFWKVICGINISNINTTIESEISFFETGIMNPKITGWNGAQWLTKVSLLY